MTNSLFSKTDFLEEKPSDIDALGYENEIMQVKARIDRLVEKDKHSIVAYLGPFGVGKSTILRAVRKQTPEYRWVTFEMWRYANRNELWDGFVIKLAAEMDQFKDEFEIADDIEGKTLNWREYIGLGIWIIAIAIGSLVISISLWHSLRTNDTASGQFLVAYLKYASPVVVTILLLVGLDQFLKLKFISEKRPLRRVFELENLLLKKVKNMKKPLVVVVEDVDRSAEDGTVFLETLNHFLNNSRTLGSKPFIVIAPQSRLAFDKYNDHPYKGLETALKIYNEKIYFNSAMSDESIAKFYNDLGVDPVWKSQITQATQAIISAHKRTFTIRLLKHALREVIQFSEMNSNINPVIALAIVLSRYVEVPAGAGSTQLALRTLDSHEEFGSEGARAFFIAIALGIDSYEEANQAQTFVLNFNSSGEPETDLFTHPVGSKRFTINIAEIYNFLII